MIVITVASGALAAWCLIDDDRLGKTEGVAWSFPWTSSARFIVLGVLSATVAFLLIGGVAGAVIGVLAGAAVTWGFPRFPTAAQARREQRLRQQLPLTLLLLASAVEAGVPLRTAVDHVRDICDAPTRDLLATVSANLDIGRSQRQAWSVLEDEPSWAAVAVDVARSADSGAAVGQVLKVHADEASADLEAEMVKQAKSVGVKAIGPLVACYLPAFLLVAVVPIIASTLEDLIF